MSHVSLQVSSHEQQNKWRVTCKLDTYAMLRCMLTFDYACTTKLDYFLLLLLFFVILVYLAHKFNTYTNGTVTRALRDEVYLKYWAPK